MLADLRFVLRSLGRTPGFTAVSVLILAFGLGAGATLFSLVHQVLLRPLALPEPDRLVDLQELAPSVSPTPLPVNAAHFTTWQERATSFDHLVALAPSLAALRDERESVPVALTHVTADFLSTLGLAPLRGRDFAAEDARTGHNDVVLAAESLWRSRYQAAPDFVGHTVYLDRRPHTVIGIVPDRSDLAALNLAAAGFSAPDFYKPLVFGAEELARKMGNHNYRALGRLRPGSTLASAGRELDLLGAAIAQDAGFNGELRGIVTPLHDKVVGPARRGLWLLSAAVGAVLLIGCVNLAALLLARAEQRRAEIALRAALGADRGRIFRLALLEPLVLAGLGAAGALLFAQLALDALPHLAPGNVPRLAEVRLDLTVTAFAAGLALLCALAAGLVPAAQLAGFGPGAGLRPGGRGVAGSARAQHTHRILVAVQVALSLVLLAGAAVLTRSLHRLLTADQGFSAPRLVTARILLPAEKYPDAAQRLEFFARLDEKLAAAGEIEGAAATNRLPLQGETWIDKIWVPGDGLSPAQRPNVNIRFVSAGYFSTLGLPLQSGRTFAPDDRANQTVIISRQLAELLWPGHDPVGRVLTRDGTAEATVIGVVADVRAEADRAPVPTLYRPLADWPPLRTNLIVRARGSTAAALAALRGAVQALDPDAPLTAARTMDEIASGATAPQRFLTLLTSAFAVVATILTALGLYGIVAYSVACRTKEFGVRLALGAAPDALPVQVARHYLPPVLVGLAAGLAAYLALGPLLRQVLFETNPAEPVLLGAIAALMASLAFLFAWLPARRAARVDPMIALRAE